MKDNVNNCYSIHFDESVTTPEVLKITLDEFFKSIKLNPINTTLLIMYPTYDYLQKYGLNLDYIKLLKVYSKRVLNYWDAFKGSEDTLNSWMEGILFNNATSIFIGDITDSLNDQFIKVNQLPGIKLVQIKL